MSIIIPDPSRGSDRHAKTALPLFHGDSISRSRSLSRAYEEGSSSRDNIDHEIVDKESGDFLFFSLPLSFFRSHVCRFASCTHAQVRVHVASDRSRASFEKQCKRERHAGLSFLPTFLLAHVVVPGSCSLPVPLFGAFPIRLPRGLSFALSLSTGYTLVHRRSFSFSAFLSPDLWCRHACVCLALFRLCCTRGRDTTAFLRCYPTSPSPFALACTSSSFSSRSQILRPSRFVFQKCSPSLPIRPCSPIDAAPIAPV